MLSVYGKINCVKKWVYNAIFTELNNSCLEIRQLREFYNQELQFTRNLVKLYYVRKMR